MENKVPDAESKTKTRQIPSNWGPGKIGEQTCRKELEEAIDKKREQKWTIRSRIVSIVANGTKIVGAAVDYFTK